MPASTHVPAIAAEIARSTSAESRAMVSGRSCVNPVQSHSRSERPCRSGMVSALVRLFAVRRFPDEMARPALRPGPGSRRNASPAKSRPRRLGPVVIGRAATRVCGRSRRSSRRSLAATIATTSVVLSSLCGPSRNSRRIPFLSRISTCSCVASSCSAASLSVQNVRTIVLLMPVLILCASVNARFPLDPRIAAESFRFLRWFRGPAVQKAGPMWRHRVIAAATEAFESAKRLCLIGRWMIVCGFVQGLMVPCFGPISVQEESASIHPANGR